MNAKIEQLTPAEQDWIQQQIAIAKDFVHQIVGTIASDLPSPEDLDKAFYSWSHSVVHDTSQANDIINCTGAAFGQHIVNATGLQWVIAVDEYGTELAVYGLPGAGDVLIYPQNLVAKRYEAKSGLFIAETLKKITADVSKIQNQQQNKKWWKP